jgi:hypothetical protein
MREWCDAIESLPGVVACAYEPFPFDVMLPRVAPGRIVLPAAEPGIRSYAHWSAEDGVEVPVYAEGLLFGRFVVRGERATCGVGFPPGSRARMLQLAERAALTARTDRAPSVRAR